MQLSADWAGEIIAWLRSHDVATRPLLAQLGIDARDLTFGRQIAVRSFAAILDYGAAETRDADFGLHRGGDFEIKRGGILAYLAASAETVGEAIARFQRYASIVCDGFTVSTEPGRDGVEIVLEVADPAWRTCRHLGAYSAARTIGALRRITGTDLHPMEMRFMQVQGGSAAECRRFFQCGIGHDARGDIIKLSTATLATPIPTADSRLGQILQAYADNLLKHVRRKPKPLVAEEVENVIIECLPSGKVSLRDVAARLKVSDRTLRRRLAESDVRFGDLLDQVRRNLSERWLAETEFDLKHISFLLGYSEPAAFSRAYKRWTGQSPGRARVR